MSGPAWASTSSKRLSSVCFRKTPPSQLRLPRLIHTGQAPSLTRLSQIFQPSPTPSRSGKAKDKSPAKGGIDHTSGSAEDALEMLLDGGYIRQSSSGVFIFLAPGLKLLKSVESIIEEEMAAIHASRIDMPTLLSSTLWKKSGRVEAMGQELFQLNDRKGSEFLLAPTHEEEVTRLVCSAVQSFRDLPVRVYQMTRKFRDEPRPRMGLLRTREFVMKDLYSFDEDMAQALASYQVTRTAYSRVMNRLFGKDGWRTVEADSGAMGGKRSHEYHVEDPSGEDNLLSCNSCSYSANIEAAVSGPLTSADASQGLPLIAEDVEIRLFSDLPPHYNLRNEPSTLTALVMPKGEAINVSKVGRTLPDQNHQQIYPASSMNAGSKPWQWDWEATPEGPLPAFSKLRIVTDPACASVSGEDLEEAVRASVCDFNAPPGRENVQNYGGDGPSLADFFPESIESEWADLRIAQSGSRCPRCSNGHLQQSKAIEVGHTFLLGTKYTESLGYTFASRTSAEQPKQLRKHVQMGCYGLGVTRILGVLAIRARRDFVSKLVLSRPEQVTSSEQSPGLLWPTALAPYTHAVVIANQTASQAVDEASEPPRTLKAVLEEIHGGRSDEQCRILLDDRVPGLELREHGAIRYGDATEIGTRYKGLGMAARLTEIDLLGVPHVSILRPVAQQPDEEDIRYTITVIR